jgi:hypothetical protein
MGLEMGLIQIVTPCKPDLRCQQLVARLCITAGAKNESKPAPQQHFNNSNVGRDI